MSTSQPTESENRKEPLNDGKEEMAAIEEVEGSLSLDDPETEEYIQKGMEELREVMSMKELADPLEVQHGIGAKSSAMERDLLKKRLKVLSGERNPLSDEEEEVVEARPYRRKSRIRIDSLKPTKFDGTTSYTLWKHAMLTVLELSGHKDIMLGIDKYPFEGTDDEQSEWRLMDCEARAVLQVYLMGRPLQLISTCTFASEAWKVLKDTYVRDSRAHKAHLLTEYARLVMTSGMSMEAYITEVKALLDNLMEVGLIMDEEMKVINLLRGLSDEYEVERKILSASESFNFEEVCARLLSDSLMSRKPSKEPPQANTAQARGRGGGSKAGGKKKGSYCYVCGDANHISPQCPHKKADGEKVFVCYTCKKPGHKAAECRSKKVGRRGGKPASAN